MSHRFEINKNHGDATTLTYYVRFLIINLRLAFRVIVENTNVVK